MEQHRVRLQIAFDRTKVCLHTRPFVTMENTDWEPVLQFVSEPMDVEFGTGSDADNLKPIAERTDRNMLALPFGKPPTPPVRWVFHSRCGFSLTGIDFRTQ